jgi:hypothetical protein
MAEAWAEKRASEVYNKYQSNWLKADGTTRSRELLQDISNALEVVASEKDAEIARLRSALKRILIHGLSHSEQYSASESYAMAEWIRNGIVGELPEVTCPFIKEALGKERR